MNPRRPVVGAVAAAVIIAAGVAFSFERWASGLGPSTAETVVDLPTGIGLRGIADRLAAAGIVDHAWPFMALARLEAGDHTLRAGEYRFLPGMGPRAVLALLTNGRTLLHAVTVPEGLTVRAVLDLLAQSSVLSGEMPPLPPEGTLLPETWLVPRGEPRARLVARMAAGMAEALEQAWTTRAPNLPLATPQEALTLASLIERETARDEERPLVAAVLLNRLRRRMPLQTDPTVIYAVSGGRGTLERELGRADLDVDDPYNTYRRVGLPPGPIANPGRAALAAAVHPAPVPYLFFVADGEGGHAFATSLDEHNRNVRAWRDRRRLEGASSPAR